jgi:hypothetical protein
LALDGNVVVVGATPDPNMEPLRSGEAHGFVRDNNGVWNYDFTLSSDEAEPGSRFGAFVAIGHGLLVVSEPQAVGLGGAQRGAVHIYSRQNGAWVRVARLAKPEGRDQGSFGRRVAILDGMVLVADLHHGDVAGDDPGPGAVFLYAPDPDGQWRLIHQLDNPNAGQAGSFGLGLDAYDNAAFIGAPTSDVTDENRGRGYFFQLKVPICTEDEFCLCKNGIGGSDCSCQRETREDHEYLFCSGEEGWEDARIACQAEGTDLVIVGGEAENGWLFERLVEVGLDRPWIGLSDAEQEDTFLWVDGSPLDFSNWAPNEPNDFGLEGGEDCIAFWTQGATWNDENCRRTRPFICESPAPADP